jgi:hypothetical protein
MYGFACIATFQLQGISKNKLMICVNDIIFTKMAKILICEIKIDPKQPSLWRYS